MVDAGPDSTYEEKMRVPPPPWAMNIYMYFVVKSILIQRTVYE